MNEVFCLRVHDDNQPREKSTTLRIIRGAPRLQVGFECRYNRPESPGGGRGGRGAGKQGSKHHCYSRTPEYVGEGEYLPGTHEVEVGS